ncbi:MAG: Ig-like domain repeat protein [Bacteroidota bacterium]
MNIINSPVRRPKLVSFIGYIVMVIFILSIGSGVSQAQTPSIQTSVSSLSGFIQTDSIKCPSQSYVVSSTYITADVVITAPAGFEISTDQNTWVAPPNSITVGQTGSTIPATTIFVRLNTAAIGAYSGNIVNSATDAPSALVSVSGNRYAKSPTNTSLGTDINPSATGQTITLTSNVTSPLPGTPTGTVTFYDGASSLGTVALSLSASASMTTSSLSFGSHNLTATYNEDAKFGTSTSSIVSQHVLGATSGLIISNNNPSVVGQSVTLTATVSSTSPGTPTGSVTFYDGAAVLGSPAALSGGSAAISTSILSPGLHSITAVYGGDASYVGSTSLALNQMVKATTNTTLLSNHNPSVTGQTVTVSASITSITPGSITGTVTFYDGGVQLGLPVAVSSGSAAYSAAYSASSGSHTFTATYSGDVNYATSSSSTVNQTVNPANTVAVISANHNPSSIGQLVTFTATVGASSPGAGTPTGSVTFSIDGTPSTPVALSGGQGSTSTSTLTVGTHAITVHYSGDADFNAGTSATYADTVNPTITASAGAHGSISPNGGVVVTYGSNQPFAITPAIGYRVDSFYIDGVGKLGAEADTFYNVTTNHTITATFVHQTQTITVSTDANGSATPTGVVTVLRGDSLVITFTGAAHYHVADVLLDSVSVGAVSSYTLHNVVANHIVSATFTIDTYSITATPGANGSITPSGGVVVNYGSDQTFAVTPDPHYLIDSVVVDGVSVGAVSSYPFAAVSAAHTILAYFKLSPLYEASFRTFPYDSLIVQKAIAKIPVTEHWEISITNTLVPDLTEINIVFKNNVKEILSSGAFTATGTGKTWKLSGSTLHHLNSVLLKGRSLKPGVQKIAKLYLGPITPQPTIKNLSMDKDWPELPEPNAATVRDLAFNKAGFKLNPWIIGCPEPDSATVYGWVALKTSSDMYKSLYDRGTHTNIGKGFDFLGTRIFKGRLANLPPTKQNNKTFADLLSFKFNILLSQLKITPPGLDSLQLMLPTSPFDSMLFCDIAHIGDSMMTYHDEFVDVPQWYTSMDSLLEGLNSAFSGRIDTSNWSDSLVIAGTTRLQDIAYLQRSTGRAPVVRTPRKGLVHLPEKQIPTEARLEQNYPNPFNPTTTVSYQLPADSRITLTVYNILGQEVTVLANGVQTAGSKSVEWNASNVASGIYFCRLTAIDQNDQSKTFTQIRKMILLK